MKEILHLCKLPPGLYRTHCSTKKLYSKANIFTLTFGSDWRRPPSDAASVLSHTGSAAALRFSSSTAGGRCGSSVAAAAAADASGVAQIHQPSISFPRHRFRCSSPGWRWTFNHHGFCRGALPCWVSGCHTAISYTKPPGYYHLLLLLLFCLFSSPSPAPRPHFPHYGAMDIHLIIPSVGLLARYLYIFRLLIFCLIYTEKHDTWIMNFN